jgi:hypothetical protein
MVSGARAEFSVTRAGTVVGAIWNRFAGALVTPTIFRSAGCFHSLLVEIEERLLHGLLMKMRRAPRYDAGNSASSGEKARGMPIAARPLSRSAVYSS